MGLFERLERALERLVEGRLLGGSRGRVHPVEIARMLAQRMQNDRRIGIDRTYVPNIFEVDLNPADHAPLAPIACEVEAEMVEYLRRQVKQRDYATSGPLRVTLRESPAVAVGGLEVSTRFEKAAQSEVAVPAPSEPVSAAPRPAQPAGTRAILLGNGGFVEGKVIPLKTDAVMLGRSPDCAVHVPDAQVSKAHARLQWNGVTYVLSDAGRNGTWVNGQRIEGQAALRHGDEIRVGASSLHFRLLG